MARGMTERTAIAPIMVSLKIRTRATAAAIVQFLG